MSARVTLLPVIYKLDPRDALNLSRDIFNSAISLALLSFANPFFPNRRGLISLLNNSDVFRFRLY